MSKKYDSLPQIRIDPEHYQKLEALSREALGNPPIRSLANVAIGYGLPKLSKQLIRKPTNKS